MPAVPSIDCQLAYMVEQLSGTQLGLRDSSKAVVAEFLTSGTAFAAKREAAWKVFQTVSEDLFSSVQNLDFVEQLRLYEDATGRLAQGYRDHLVHSVYVYLLGLLLHANWDSVRRAWSHAYEEKPANWNVSFHYYWALTALFHDCAYPVEICIRSLNNYLARVFAPQSSVSMVLLQLRDLDFPSLIPGGAYAPEDPESDHALRMICRRLVAGAVFDCSARTAEDLVRSRFLRSSAEGKIDHGLLGSLVLLRQWGTFCRKRGVPLPLFLSHYGDAASAIFVHHLYDYFWSREVCPGAKLALTAHPLAFLLMLSDRLQQWGRREFTDVDVDEAGDNQYYEGYNLQMDTDQLRLRVPGEKRQKVERAIESVLSVGNQVGIG